MSLLAAFRGLWRRPLAVVRFWRLSRRLRQEAVVRERVDLLLDRVARDGMDALSPAERRFLYRASRLFKAPHEEPAAARSSSP